jgi:hypothetical protein
MCPRQRGQTSGRALAAARLVRLPHFGQCACPAKTGAKQVGHASRASGVRQ